MNEGLVTAENMHSLGGMPLKSWAKGHNTVDTQASRYAKNIIAGNLPNEGFDHRQYLSKNNWQWLARSLSRRDERVVEGKTNDPRRKYEVFSYADPGYLYALLESKIGYSLDDYLADNPKKFEPSESRYKFYNGRWLRAIPHEEVYNEIDWDSKEGTVQGVDWYPTGTKEVRQTVYTYESLDDETTMLNEWGLPAGFIDKPLLTHSKKIPPALIAKAKTDPEYVKEILKLTDEQLVTPAPRFGIDSQDINYDELSHQECITRLSDAYKNHFGIRPFIYINEGNAHNVSVEPVRLLNDNRQEIPGDLTDPDKIPQFRAPFLLKEVPRIDNSLIYDQIATLTAKTPEQSRLFELYKEQEAALKYKREQYDKLTEAIKTGLAAAAAGGLLTLSAYLFSQS